MLEGRDKNTRMVSGTEDEAQGLNIVDKALDQALDSSLGTTKGKGNKGLVWASGLPSPKSHLELEAWDVGQLTSPCLPFHTHNSLLELLLGSVSCCAMCLDYNLNISYLYCYKPISLEHEILKGRKSFLSNLESKGIVSVYLMLQDSIQA